MSNPCPSLDQIRGEAAGRRVRLARTDADFVGILHYPPVVSLLYLDRAPLLRERPEEE